LARAASLTLGPGVSIICLLALKGRNVALEYEGGEPKITKDGVTVVKSVFETKRERDMGARLAKRIAGNTNLFAGDGTTTSTLLSKVMLE
jgi:chaperonin GroEL